MRIFDLLRSGIPVLFLVIALFALSYSLDARSLAVDSKSWPTAPGVVVTSAVGTEAHRGGGTYEPRVTYSYTVAGTSYHGNVVRSGGFDYGNRPSAEAKLAEYPVGAAVDVRYDPDDPSRSALESGGGGDWWLIGGAGIAFGVTGAVLLFGTVRDAWARRTQASTSR